MVLGAVSRQLVPLADEELGERLRVRAHLVRVRVRVRVRFRVRGRLRMRVRVRVRVRVRIRVRVRVRVRVRGAHLLGVRLELGRGHLLELRGQAGDLVVVRPTWLGLGSVLGLGFWLGSGSR